jgi:hypothetical protein
MLYVFMQHLGAFSNVSSANTWSVEIASQWHFQQEGPNYVFGVGNQRPSDWRAFV